MNPKSNKLEQLEGLRGVAALAVVFSHLRRTFFLDLSDQIAEQFGEIPRTIFEAFVDGNFAVWLFWVMSALVLSLRFHQTSSGDKILSQMSDATIRRYPRLFIPVFASVMVAWLFHQLGWMSNAKLADHFGRESHWWLVQFYQFEPNFLQAIRSAIWDTFFDFQLATSYNNVLWTMEIELYGSFFLFGFLCLIGKHPKRHWFYLLSLIIIWKLKLHWINAFICGTMICDIYVNLPRLQAKIPHWLKHLIERLFQSPYLMFLMLPVVLFMIGLSNLGEILHLFLATIITAYVLVSRPAIWVLTHRIFVFLGKISFGLYLIHFPILAILAYPLYMHFADSYTHVMAASMSSIAIIGTSVVSAWCFWYLFDRPAIAASRQISQWLNR